MDVKTASLSALATAVMRAVHTRCDPEPLIEDPYGDELLTDAERSVLLQRLLLTLSEDARAELEQIGDPGRALDRAIHAHPAYAGVLVRARYAEDLLKVAIQRGTNQYVLVGAGMDTFVFRRPDLSKELVVFEIDHAESQAQKRQRLERAGLEPPANVYFINADLERESVGQMLAGTSYSRDTPAFFTWLGVTPYLTRDANLHTLRSISSCAAEGSELVFDYVAQAGFSAEQSSDDTGRFLAERQSSDEPFLSGFDPAQIGQDLVDAGFDLVEDLAPADAEARYCEGRADGLRLVAPGHIVHAFVAPRPEV